MENEYCVFCGRPAECKHHLLFGMSLRKLCDDDYKNGAAVVLPMCNQCHNMAVKSEDRIHGNPAAEKLSKMLGQALWENWYKGDNAREAFRQRYGKSFL